MAGGNFAMGVKEHIVFPRDQLRQGRSDLGNGHHRLYGLRRRTTRPGRCSRLSTSPSASNGSEKGQASTWPRQVQSRRTRSAARWSKRFGVQACGAQDAHHGSEQADRGAFPRSARASPPCRANSSKTRIRNRCEVTGRPRGYYRKLKMSRIALRELGNNGLIPGLVKSSW